MKKVITKLTIALTALIMALSFTSCGTSYYGASGDGYYENYYDYNPAWAPDYFWGTRYYYFPDIETYYDLATRNFVYLNNGQWLFVQALPTMYSTFNLHNAFIVIVNRNVFNPWMHHHYYNSHYPRYYYIDYYDYSNIPYVRGYNESGRRAVYWKDSERSRAREWGDRSIREGRNFKYSTDDRRVQQEVTRRISQSRTITSPSELSRIGNAEEGRMTSRDAYPATNRTSTTTRTTQTPTRQTTTSPQRTSTRRSEETNYYGGSIGQPVRVEPQMRGTTSERTSTTRESSTTTRSTESGTSGRSSGGRR